jgi:hypothetical protein
VVHSILAFVKKTSQKFGNIFITTTESGELQKETYEHFWAM